MTTTFKQAVNTAHKAKKTTTENGMPARVSSTKYVMDYFFKVGAMRQETSEIQVNLFLQAYDENEDLAVRALLWSRDVREGAAERSHIRNVLSYLGMYHYKIAERIAKRIPELGRWDDLFVLFNTPAETKTLQLIKAGLLSKDPLCAKWMPREKSSKPKLAYKIRKYMNLTPKQYRKLLASLTDVVETKMCNNKWEEINYSHVPSQASYIYSKAFAKHDTTRYEQFVSDAATGTNGAKVNAGAIFPYDVIKGTYIYDNLPEVDKNRIRAQWKELPNFITTNKNILPMIDVSASMDRSAGGSKTTCMDVAVSLGLYVAEKQQGAFRDMFLTFSESPKLVQCTGDILQKLDTVYASAWGMSTDLEKAVELVYTLADEHNVPKEEMPEYLIIFSDMQFNRCVRNPDFSANKMIKEVSKKRGYKKPKIVFWNLYNADNVPVKAGTNNTALVSGFSPAIMKGLLADVTKFNPETIMLDTIRNTRYNY